MNENEIKRKDEKPLTCFNLFLAKFLLKWHPLNIISSTKYNKTCTNQSQLKTNVFIVAVSTFHFPKFMISYQESEKYTTREIKSNKGNAAIFFFLNNKIVLFIKPFRLSCHRFYLFHFIVEYFFFISCSSRQKMKNWQNET